ncbi:DUF4124 domain-containing protein [Kaarinaea lacus]
MKRYISLLACFLVSGALITSANAGVYKRVNPDGSVEFTDIPNEVGQKPVEVTPPSSYKPPRLPPPKAEVPAGTPESAAVSYESVAITSPANDATVRDNAGNITVTVTSKPALHKDHTFVLMMDGKQVGKGTKGKFQLNNIDRGSHGFHVQISDDKGKMLMQSQPVTVHLHRASKMHPAR